MDWLTDTVYSTAIVYVTPWSSTFMEPSNGITLPVIQPDCTVTQQLLYLRNLLNHTAVGHMMIKRDE